MKKSILWDSKHLEFDTMTGSIQQVEEGEKISEQEFVDGMDEEAIMAKVPKLMQTHLGVFSMDDSMNPLKEFEFWQGHTNFDITPSVAQTIQNIEGVEVLNVMTRYRFFVAVGRQFSFKEVRRDIEMALCDETSQFIRNDFEIADEDVFQKALDLQEELQSKYEQWAIVILPNGEIDHCFLTEGNEEKFYNDLEKFRESESEVGSLLIEPDKTL